MVAPPLPDRATIASLIPHQGNMCLIDEVLRWDAQCIHAKSTTLHQRFNPLLHNGELHCVVLVEYAAQVAAVHAALAGTGMNRERAAVVGAVKQLQLHTPLVSPVLTEITLEAHCILNNSDGAIYQLAALGEGEVLMQARVVLVLQ